MNMNEYQELAARTINLALTPQQVLHHALFEMSSEMGEISGIYQKELQGHEIDKQHLKKEIGDLLWGVAELCTVNGIKMSEIAEMNIDKLLDRYPDGFDEERSKHRAEGDV